MRSRQPWARVADVISPKNIMPDGLIDAAKKDEVIRYIMVQPWTPHFKHLALLGWAVTVGVKIDKATYAQVDATGINLEE